MLTHTEESVPDQGDAVIPAIVNTRSYFSIYWTLVPGTVQSSFISF